MQVKPFFVVRDSNRRAVNCEVKRGDRVRIIGLEKLSQTTKVIGRDIDISKTKRWNVVRWNIIPNEIGKVQEVTKCLRGRISVAVSFSDCLIKFNLENIEKINS